MELEHIRKDSQHQKEEIQKLSNEVVKLTSNMTIIEVESNALKEENKILKEDISTLGNLSKDEIVNRTLKLRDDTISRKNMVEIELAKVRIELMHVNSQLLETIQQKVELSQQLEQWQVRVCLFVCLFLLCWPPNNLFDICIICPSIDSPSFSFFISQVDMEILIEDQLKRKLSSQEKNKTTVVETSVKKDNLFGRIRFPKLLNYQN